MSHMQIQISTDHNIEGSEGLTAHVRGVVLGALGRIGDHITRVTVHLSDESSQKSTRNDQRCVMEAHVEGRRPVAATHHAPTLDQAIDGAMDKLARMIEGALGRMHDQQNRSADPESYEPKTAE